MKTKIDGIESEELRIELEKRLIKYNETGKGDIDEIMNSLCTHFPNEWKPIPKEELDEYKNIEAQLSGGK